MLQSMGSQKVGHDLVPLNNKRVPDSKALRLRNWDRKVVSFRDGELQEGRRVDLEMLPRTDGGNCKWNGAS